MSQDRFKPRSRASIEGGGNNQPYDFSAIANEAVSKSRAQEAGADNGFDAPEAGRKRFAKKSRDRSAVADPWDQSVSRDSVPSDDGADSRRKPFGRRRDDADLAEMADKKDGERASRRKISDIVKLLPQSVTGKDGFDKPTDPDEDALLESSRRKKERKPRGAGEWDKPVSRGEALGQEEEAPRRKPLAFGRKSSGESQSADEFDNIQAPPPPPRPAPASGRTGGDFFDEPERDTVEAAQSKPRHFNAAQQPNYSYMTDSEPEPAPTAAPQIAPEGGISALKASLMRRLGQDEPGVEYYTPPANRAPTDVRRHQKRRNRRPLPQWLKFTIFGLCLAAAFFCIVYAAFFIIITSRIDYVGDSTRNTVYLSVEEKANHEADLTDTEENAAEFTEPISIADQREDVKVIMVVSSDSQPGDNGGITARTDAIMLIAVDPEHQRLRIASIMTDTYVRIRDYQSNKLSKAYYYDTVVGDYSLTRLRQAVEDNFGVIPDNYVIVDFDALQILVERLGGVDVTVSADEAYYMSHHKRYGNFPRFNSEGPYTMSGPEALNYVRMRDVGNGDYDRVARQRKVFSQILVKMQSKSKYELAQLAYQLLPELPTDMSAGDVFGYLTDLSDLASYEVTEVTFPITNSWRYGTATVRDEAEYVFVTDSVVSSSDAAVSSGDLTPSAPSAPDSRPTSDTKFTVIVTNFQFNATALQRYLYDNDESYLNGAAANGVTVPEIIAPLESGSPASGIAPAA